MSQDILSNFNADSREVTDAKIQAMRDAKLDTTQIEKQVAVLRQQDAAYKAQLKADSLAQQSAGKDTQRQYIAQFGAVYSNSLGNQTPKSSSFLDNLLGNLYADEGKGNYVRYDVSGDHIEFAGDAAYQGSMLGDMYGYNKSLIAPILWNTAADRAAYDKAQQAEQNDFKDKYQFAMMNDKFSDKEFGQATIGVWDGINRSPVINPRNSNPAIYEFGALFGMDPIYDQDLIQMNSELISTFVAGSGYMKATKAVSSAILKTTSKVLPFVKNSITAEMAINGTVGGISSMTTNALVNENVDFFSLSNLTTGGFGFLNASLSTKYNSFTGLLGIGFTTTVANEVLDGNTNVKNIFAKASVGAGMNMFFGKGLKYQIAPYEGGRAMAGFQKYVFPATVAGWYEMSNELIFNEIDKKKK
ncbi:MAG TPA: hypothetical protein PLQ69_10655 [Paludibacter sp.]|nr:hypothetical protein [Paludibacter sp.]